MTTQTVRQDASWHPASRCVVSESSRAAMGGAGLFRFPARVVDICMSPFDCHINRVPIARAVTYAHYNPGRFELNQTVKGGLTMIGEVA